MTLGTEVLKETPVARTPVSGPRPGKKFEHLRHGVVEVVTIEDDMVVFRRPDDKTGHAYVNNRQQPLAQFKAQTVNVR